MRALLLALTLFGCDNSRSPPERLSAGCRSNSDCPAALRCVEQACVGGRAPNWALRLRVRPDSNGPLATFDVLGDAEFKGSSVLRLDGPIELPTRVDIRGRVFVMGSTPAPVLVAATATAGVTSAPLRFSSGEPLLAGDEPRYLLSLAQNWPKLEGGNRLVTYDLHVTTLDESLPPRSFPAVPLSELSDISDFPEGPLRRIEGRVLLNEANPTPLRDVLVSATSTEGEPLSTRFLSDETGAFEVTMWPAAPDEVVLLARSSVREQPLPTVTLQTNLATQTEATIFMGEVGSIIQIRGQLVDEAGEVLEDE